MEILVEGPLSVTTFSQTRGFEGVAGESYDFSLLCNESVSLVWLRNIQMTALFVAN